MSNQALRRRPVRCLGSDVAARAHDGEVVRAASLNARPAPELAGPRASTRHWFADPRPPHDQQPCAQCVPPGASGDPWSPQQRWGLSRGTASATRSSSDPHSYLVRSGPGTCSSSLLGGCCWSVPASARQPPPPRRAGARSRRTATGLLVQLRAGCDVALAAALLALLALLADVAEVKGLTTLNDDVTS